MRHTHACASTPAVHSVQVALLLALATSVAAWAGSDGTDCNFPDLAWISIDQSEGYSATYDIEGGFGNADVFAGGYLTGHLNFETTDATGAVITPAACGSSADTGAAHGVFLSHIDGTGKNLRTWRFDTTLYSSGTVIDEIATVGSTHVAVAFQVNRGTLTIPSLGTYDHDLTNGDGVDGDVNSMGVVCMIDAAVADPSWCKIYGQYAGSGNNRGAPSEPPRPVPARRLDSGARYPDSPFAATDATFVQPA